MKRIGRAIALVFALVVVSPLAAFELRFATWNLESGGSDAATITGQLAALRAEGSYDVYALTEVDDDALGEVQRAIDPGGTYAVVWSAAGGNDRILLAVNTEKVTLVDWGELTEISLVSYRPALWARLQRVDDGSRILVVAVHLARGGPGEEFSRYAQARALRIWASRRTSTPIVLLGDCNFDLNVETGAVDRVYALLTDGDLRWIRPSPIVPTISGSPACRGRLVAVTTVSAAAGSGAPRGDSIPRESAGRP